MSLFCSGCGIELPFGARFCSTCGLPVPAPETMAGTVIPRAAMPRARLVRPRFGRRVAGVCLGLSQYFRWDVTVTRILAVVGFCCSGGFVAIVYLACWIGMPEEQPLLP